MVSYYVKEDTDRFSTFKAYATVFFAYKNSAAASKTRHPEPVFRWDPFQGASIWYFLQKLVKKNGKKVLLCL